jgi:hypothetical protein
MKNDIRSYLAQRSNAKLVSEVVRGSLGRTFAAKLLARTLVVGAASAVFFLVSPAAGFVALAVGIFLL